MHYCLGDYIADIVENSIEAAATQINVTIIEKAARVVIRIADNGIGIAGEQLQNVIDPFYTTKQTGRRHRRVGLGLSFLKQLTAETAGEFTLNSQPGKGTTVQFALDAENIDVPPLGDLVSCFLTLLTFESDEYNLDITRFKGEQSYTLSKRELTVTLGNLQEAENLILLKKFLIERETKLKEEA